MRSVLARYDDAQLAVLADFMQAVTTTQWPVRSTAP